MYTELSRNNYGPIGNALKQIGIFAQDSILPVSPVFLVIKNIGFLSSPKL